MQLQRAGSNHARHRPFDRSRDNLCLATSTGKDHDLACFENCPDTHRDRIDGYIFTILKKTRVVVDRRFCQRFQTSTRRKRAGWLVERDMAIRTDAEQLDIDTATFLDPLLIPLAKSFIVSCRSRGNINVLAGDIDVLKEILVHKVMVALRMIDRQTHILVEIERCDL